jgi:hypothetical protein
MTYVNPCMTEPQITKMLPLMMSLPNDEESEAVRANPAKTMKTADHCHVFIVLPRKTLENTAVHIVTLE